MKKILFFAALFCCPVLLLYGVDSTITLNGNEWKIFKYVNGGTVTAGTDGSVAVKTKTDGRGLHYYFDKNIPVREGMTVQMSFDYKGSFYGKKPANLGAAFYLFNASGKYMNKAHNVCNIRLRAGDHEWHTVSKTVELNAGTLSGEAKGLKFFIHTGIAAEVTIRNLKVTFKRRDPASENRQRFPLAKSFLPEATTFPLGKYWKNRRIGKKDFYVAELGFYTRLSESDEKAYWQTGLFPGMIPGYWRLNEFAPGRKLAPWQQKLRDMFLQNEYPVCSMNYQRMQGNPPPDEEAVKAVEHLWIGDGQPEEPIYRIEPVIHYLRTGKKWQGSSMYLWKDAEAVKYFSNVLKPLLDKELPGCGEENYKWTRAKEQRLREIYCLSYLDVNQRPFIYTMYLAPYTIASARKDLVSVSAKAGDPAAYAVLRGVARQSGGNKFIHSWRGHEPLERYSNRAGRWNNRPERRGWGLPEPHANYYVFRPYLGGANYYVNETFPSVCVSDSDNNKVYHLSKVGRLVKKLLQFSEDYPERGTLYTPAAFIKGYDRYSKYFFVSQDRADWMDIGIENLLLPEHRHVRGSGRYSMIAPFGENMDILRPNPTGKLDPGIFDGYKLLIAGGGVTYTKEYKDILKKYVSDGGSLLINAEDAKDNFTADFLGVHIKGKFSADQIRNNISGKIFAEKRFTCRQLVPAGAKVIYSANGKPAVTLFKYGKGHVMVTAPVYLVTDASSAFPREAFKNRPALLNFATELFENLFDSVAPFTVKVPAESKEDFSWVTFRKGDNWTVAVFNYSIRREEIAVDTYGTGGAAVTYPYKKIPFEIIPKVPVSDVAELFGSRDVRCIYPNGKLVVSESMYGGELRLYEFSNKKVELPTVTRYVNYALNRPVKATSAYSGYVPELAVDGHCDNEFYWQSAPDKKAFHLPEMLTVDLQQERQMNRIFIKFRTAGFREQGMEPVYMQYLVQYSADGKEWHTALDESANCQTVTADGDEFTVPQFKGRYVRLKILHNSGFYGASVVEFAVMGKDTRKVKLQRKSIVPPWVVKFPPEIENAKKITYLTKLKPLSVKPGWMPINKKWEQLNGTIKLYTSPASSAGAVFNDSLYGESVFEAEYAIPANAEYFAAVCGFGNRDRRASVEFKVYVDGVLKYDSGIYRTGKALLPVAVDISGGKKLKLVTTDGKDNIIGDYAWWGAARFILK